MTEHECPYCEETIAWEELCDDYTFHNQATEFGYECPACHVIMDVIVVAVPEFRIKPRTLESWTPKQPS